METTNDRLKKKKDDDGNKKKYKCEFCGTTLRRNTRGGKFNCPICGAQFELNKNKVNDSPVRSLGRDFITLRFLKECYDIHPREQFNIGEKNEIVCTRHSTKHPINKGEKITKITCKCGRVITQSHKVGAYNNFYCRCGRITKELNGVLTTKKPHINETSSIN